MRKPTGKSPSPIAQADHRLWSLLRIHLEAGLDEPKSIIRHAHHARGWETEIETELRCDPDRRRTWCEQAPLGQCLSIGRRCWTARCWRWAAAVPWGLTMTRTWIPSRTSNKPTGEAALTRLSLYLFFSTMLLQVKLCMSETCLAQLAATHSANAFLPSSLPLTIKDLLHTSYLILRPLPHPSHIVFTPIDQTSNC